MKTSENRFVLVFEQPWFSFFNGVGAAVARTPRRACSEVPFCDGSTETARLADELASGDSADDEERFLTRSYRCGNWRIR